MRFNNRSCINRLDYLHYSYFLFGLDFIRLLRKNTFKKKNNDLLIIVIITWHLA